MRIKLLRNIFILGSIVIPFALKGITLDEAKEMYLAGDFAGALPVFEEALEAKPKDASLNQWVGVCLLRDGRPDEALDYLEFADSKGIVEASRYLAEIAFYDYRFDDFDNYIAKYEKGLKKSKKTMPEEVEILVDKADKTRSMLERVEKIVIIDSVAVDRDIFFKAFRLTPESGSINGPEVLPTAFEYGTPTTVFMPESKETMIWAAPDSDQNYVLVQSAQLFGGGWDTPRPLGEVLNENGGDSNFPFMMSDGLTLYYANDGEESIGGYDIFITRKNEDGFLQPQNLGMPYNSPYDDYLLAIDEVTGVGWWATDRNRLGDLITIYKFIPSDLRVNYESDAPELVDMARITSYKDTWEEGRDYSEIRAAIDAIDPDAKEVTEDFRFALPGGRIYRRWDDFKSRRARNLMEQYMERLESHNADIEYLRNLRIQYGKGDRSHRDDILRMETKIENDNKSLKTLASEIVKAEG